MRAVLVFALMLASCPALAQTASNDTVTAPPAPPPPASAPAKPAPKLSKIAMTSAELQKTVDQLTKSNSDLLDLLKKQQGVLEDMQFDRRLQSRQIQSLEERLENTVFEKTELEKKVSTLEVQLAHPATPAPAPAPTPAPAPPPASGVATDVTPPAPAIASAPATPNTNLPPPEEDKGPGMTWHRLFMLKGTDNLQSDTFKITGRSWRVRWHNQDPAGKVYQNTSALFLNAFPQGDPIPQRVCSKLGSGGDTTELLGPGTFYIKVEASGGSWELAVEDFR